MRRIRSEADLARGRKRNQIVLGVVMIVLLVFGTVGYSFVSRDDEGNVNGNKVSEFGFDFFRDGGLWKVDVGGELFGFQNLPSEVSNFSVNLSGDLNYNGANLYFVDGGVGVSEILNNVGRYVFRYQEACLSTENCEGDLPIKDCSEDLIVFVEGDEEKVYQNESCVYIVGDEIKGADAFLYGLLGVYE